MNACVIGLCGSIAIFFLHTLHEPQFVPNCGSSMLGVGPNFAGSISLLEIGSVDARARSSRFG
jgi:hypothetical protein